MGIALLCYVSSMILTFTYFYPRNEMMFLSEQLPGTETLKKAAPEWGRSPAYRQAGSVPGGQLVNSPTAQSPARYGQF